MKNLLLTLLLISPVIFADWGDVYYCQMTSFTNTSLEGKVVSYAPEKFKFQLDKAKNAMVFAKGTVFGIEPKELVRLAVPKDETWFAEDEYQRIYFQKGKFLYVQTSWMGNYSISADCDKF